MGFLNKIKTAFGNSNNTDETVDDNYIGDIIATVENIPFAVSESNVLYAGISDLAGYHYFKTVIIGTLKLKTNKGAEITIIGDDFKLKLNSDMLELESDVANVDNQYVTKIDFEIEADDIAKIVKSRIKFLELSAKKEEIKFSIIEILGEEEVGIVDEEEEE